MIGILHATCPCWWFHNKEAWMKTDMCSSWIVAMLLDVFFSRICQIVTIYRINIYIYYDILHTMWCPPVISWFRFAPVTIVISTINHSYWSYKPT